MIFAHVLHVPHERQHDGDREHPERAHQGQQERAAAREPLRRHAEHGRPVIAHADGEHGRGGEHAGLGLRVAHGEQPEQGKHGRADEQADRRDLVDELPGERPAHVHDGVDENEHQDAAGPGHVLQDGPDPLPRRQFGGSRQQHAEQPQQEQRTQRLPVHLPGRDVGLDSLGGGVRLAQEQQAVDDQG